MEKCYAPEEISALVLAHLKKAAELQFNQPVRDVVITVPAYFTDAQRQASTATLALALSPLLLMVLTAHADPTSGSSKVCADPLCEARVLQGRCRHCLVWWTIANRPVTTMLTLRGLRSTQSAYMRRQATMSAAALAHLNVGKLIKEPVAAVLAFTCVCVMQNFEPDTLTSALQLRRSLAHYGDLCALRQGTPDTVISGSCPCEYEGM